MFRQERQAALYIRRLGCDVLFVFLFAFGNSIYSGNRGEDFGGSIEQYDIYELFGIKVSTYSYFSFVAVLVAGVLYFVTAPNFATAPKTDKVAKSSQSQILEEKELKTVEVLLRYKELFDRGVITEQEYENKKRALLGESKENS